MISHFRLQGTTPMQFHTPWLSTCEANTCQGNHNWLCISSLPGRDVKEPVICTQNAEWSCDMWWICVADKLCVSHFLHKQLYLWSCLSSKEGQIYEINRASTSTVFAFHPVAAFQVLDEDSDGAIDREEFRKGLRLGWKMAQIGWLVAVSSTETRMQRWESHAWSRCKILGQWSLIVGCYPK